MALTVRSGRTILGNLCYRKLKVRAIEMHRVKTIEALLLQIDGAGMPSNHAMLCRHARMATADWQCDPQATMDVDEAHLHEHFGIDLSAVNAEVFVQVQTASLCFAYQSLHVGDRFP